MVDSATVGQTAGPKQKQQNRYKMRGDLVQVGPPPYSLVNDMEEGELKDELQQCGNAIFYRTDFSIGHRGAAMQFPEHTMES